MAADVRRGGESRKLISEPYIIGPRTVGPHRHVYSIVSPGSPAVVICAGCLEQWTAGGVYVDICPYEQAKERRE